MGKGCDVTIVSLTEGYLGRAVSRRWTLQTRRPWSEPRRAYHCTTATTNAEGKTSKRRENRAVSSYCEVITYRLITSRRRVVTNKGPERSVRFSSSSSWNWVFVKMVLLSSKKETCVRSPFSVNQGSRAPSAMGASSFESAASDRAILGTLAGHYCVSLGAGPLWCSWCPPYAEQMVGQCQPVGWTVCGEREVAPDRGHHRRSTGMSPAR